MEPDEPEEAEPEYFNEVPVCRHGNPKNAGCEWCEEEREA